MHDGVIRLQVEVASRLSCQALLAGLLAACPAASQALDQLQHLVVSLDQRHCAVLANDQQLYHCAEAVTLFPELELLDRQGWPEAAEAAEWEALAILTRLLQQQQISLRIGALPSWTGTGRGSEQLAELVAANRWPVRFGQPTACLHSCLAVAALRPYQQSGPDGSLTLSALAYGQATAAGVPEVLVFVSQAPADRQDQVAVLEANIDDQNPELYQDASELLFAAGALDVQLQPVYMKKQRPGVLLTVICRPDQAAGLATLILEQTSSLGVRQTIATRYLLERRSVEVPLLGGSVRVKLGYRADRLVNVAPEYEDCRRLAQVKQLPVKLVYQQAIAAFWQLN